ncbi:MAG: AsmA family protein [Pararhizobium sp.]
MRRTLRWVISVVTILIAVGAVIAVAVPLAVSTQRARERLEQDISEWTGEDVLLGSRPELTFWPVPNVTFHDVAILSRDAPGSEPLASADSVTADFSVLSALTGQPRFTNFTFDKPVFVIKRSKSGALNWQSSNGRIAEAASIAAADTRNDGKPKQAIPSGTLGTVTINDGTIRLADEITGRNEVVHAVNGSIDWPQLNGSARLDLTASLRSKSVHLVGSSDSPLLLLAGANAPLDVDFTAPSMSLSFSGTANLSSKPFFTGKTVFDASSVPKTLAWIGTDIRPGEAIGTLHIDATLTTQTDRVNLDNLILTIDDNRGIGVLDIQHSKNGVPVVAGTLAFNKLNITSFLKAFTPLPKPGEDIATTIDTRFLRQLGLDLRLSAQSATLGPLDLTDLAAAARIDPGRAIFEVGDSTAYGGTATGRVQISEKGLDGGGEVQLSAQNIDFGGVFDALKLSGPLPRGKGSIDMTLKSGHPLWATSIEDIKGKIKVSMRNGTIPSFDINAFRAASAKQRFFSLDHVASGSLPFTSAEFEAALSDGLAEINKATIVTADSLIELDGVIPYSQGSLAMAGSLGPKPPPKGQDAPKDAKPPLRFFVGGSWPAAVISPVVSQ